MAYSYPNYHRMMCEALKTIDPTMNMTMEATFKLRLLLQEFIVYITDDLKALPPSRKINVHNIRTVRNNFVFAQRQYTNYDALVQVARLDLFLGEQNYFESIIEHDMSKGAFKEVEKLFMCGIYHYLYKFIEYAKTHNSTTIDESDM